jgi:hypothetical protein
MVKFTRLRLYDVFFGTETHKCRSSPSLIYTNGLPSISHNNIFTISGRSVAIFVRMSINLFFAVGLFIIRSFIVFKETCPSLLMYSSSSNFKCMFSYVTFEFPIAKLRYLKQFSPNVVLYGIDIRYMFLYP